MTRGRVAIGLCTAHLQVTNHTTICAELVFAFYHAVLGSHPDEPPLASNERQHQNHAAP